MNFSRKRLNERYRSEQQAQEYCSYLNSKIAHIQNEINKLNRHLYLKGADVELFQRLVERRERLRLMRNEVEESLEGSFHISLLVETLLIAATHAISRVHAIVSEQATTRVFKKNTISRRVIEFPRIWKLFSYILPKKIRKEAFDPAYEDLKESFLDSKEFWEKHRRWLNIAFGFRTLWMVIECTRVAITSLTGKFIASLFPEFVREFFRGLMRGS